MDKNLSKKWVREPSPDLLICVTGTETMERLKRASGDGSLRWAWLSLNISPRIFSAKW